MIEVYTSLGLKADSPEFLANKNMTHRERMEHKLRRAAYHMGLTFRDKVSRPDVNYTDNKLKFLNIQNMIARELLRLFEQHAKAANILDPDAIDNESIKVKAEFTFFITSWEAKECVVSTRLRDTKKECVLDLETNMLMRSKRSVQYTLTDVAGGTHVYEDPKGVIITEKNQFTCYTQHKKHVYINFAMLEEVNILRIAFEGVPNDDNKTKPDDDTDSSCDDADTAVV